METELPPELKPMLQDSATDIAVGAVQLHNLAHLIGGDKCVAWAAMEVAKMEFYGMSLVESMQHVYRLLSEDQL